MRVSELITQYPRAFHMAESGTWNSIRQCGLLSTLALLDLFEINGELREAILRQRRASSVEIMHPKHGKAVVRDQKPMSESALRKCLERGMVPAQWYENLNKRVFFWLSESRLNGLLGARAYRSKRHCVLTIDTAGLVERHRERVALSPINSGSTIYRPQPRGPETFRGIADYPFEERRRTRPVANAIVELVVDYAVPDIEEFVLRVEERDGAKVASVLYERG